MRVLGFCEGALQRTGGFGLAGVPGIHRSLAERGHRDALALAGPPMPSARDVMVPGLDDVFESNAGARVGVVSFPAYTRWCFAPALYDASKRAAARADFITLHSLFSYPVLAGSLLARRYRRPYGVWPHGVLADVQRRVSRVRKTLYGTVAAHRILSSASVLFFSGLRERDEARSLRLSVPSVIIPHGIDLAAFAPRRDPSTFRRKYVGGHRGPLLLYVGRLNAKKGLDLLVQSMPLLLARRPDARLAIAGAGDPPAFTDRLRRWIDDAKVQGAVTITGSLDESDKLDALASCDVFAMASSAENFGFSMFEAMASGKPVVCSETLDYAPEIAQCGAGFVVPRHAAAFADALLALIADDEARLAAGAQARAVAARYSWQQSGRLLETAIGCVLKAEPFPAELSPA